MAGTWYADIETNGLYEEVTKVHCGVFKNKTTKELKKFLPHQIPDMLDFISTTEELIGHNFIAFDLKVLEKLYGFRYEGKVVDTLIMSRLLNPNRRSPRNLPNAKSSPHSLEAWGYRVGRGKPEHEEWDVFSPEMLHRCTEDVEITELTHKELMVEAEKKGDWSKAFPMTMKLFDVFNRIEDYGWKVDIFLMRALINDLEMMHFDIHEAVDDLLPYIVEHQGEVKAPFTKAGKYNANMVKWIHNHMPENIDWLETRTIGGPFSRVNFRKVDLNKRNEVVELLLNAGWIPEQWNVNDDGDRTSPKLSKTDPFDGIDGNLGKLAAKFIQVRHRKSLIEGLFKLVREDGRIGSQIKGLADTARVRHSGIVNIPNADSFFGKEIRKIFVADKDKVLVGVDSAGNQVRQLCSLMGDEAYEYEVLHGDIHETNRIAAGLPTRANAKTFFYGFIFGAGDDKTGRIIGGSAKDGRKLKEEFLDGLPKLRQLINRLTEEWRENARKKFNSRWNRWEYFDGWITGLDGRPLTIKSEHAILVYVLQNMEAIQMSYALLFSYKWLLDAGLKWGDDFGFVCFYHDEINTECKHEHKELIGETVKKAIIHAGKYLKIKTPHDGDIKYGYNWYEIH